MSIAQRIRKIREIKAWKQSAAAMALGITQQAYSVLEKEGSVARFDTLKKFCDVMGIELIYLLSEDLPVTEETMHKYGKKTLQELIAVNAKMEQKIEVYQELFELQTKVRTETQLRHKKDTGIRYPKLQKRMTAFA